MNPQVEAGLERLCRVVQAHQAGNIDRFLDEQRREAYEQGKTHQAAWWLAVGRRNLGIGKEFNTALFGLYMANKFGWRSGANRDDEALQKIRKIEEQLGMEDS